MLKSVLLRALLVDVHPWLLDLLLDEVVKLHLLLQVLTSSALKNRSSLELFQLLTCSLFVLALLLLG